MNNDLISREDLKKAISEFHQKENDRLHSPLWGSIGLNALNRIIDNAPTVETDIEVVAKDAYEHGYTDGWKERFGEPNERPQVQGEWIPVSERLPDNRDWYLGVFKEPDTDFIGIPYICDYVGEVTKGTTNEGWILRHCTDVNAVPDYFRNLICVAWRPLPEPYRKGGAE